MDTGRLINKLSNCLRRRSAETQKRIHISGTKGQILNYILIESQKRPLVQRDVEQEFGLRPSTATEMLQTLQAADLIRREPDPADALSALKKPKPSVPPACRRLRRPKPCCSAASRPRSGTHLCESG